MPAGPEEIAMAIATLRRGGLVAFPTETVYGLGASAFDTVAVEKVFRLKGRPSTNPLIVHVSGPDMAQRVVSVWPPAARTLARAFWPGPLSIVLPKSPSIPDVVTGGGPTVAVRCPDHPTTLALLEAFASPLVGPSANLSGGISPTCAEHVHDVFPLDEVLVLDGGPCRAGIESTVVLLPTSGFARVLRPGLITAEQIAEVLESKVEHATTATTPNADCASPALSPGMMDRHYAPVAVTLRFNTDQMDTLTRHADHAGRTVVLAFGPARLGAPHTTIEMPSQPDAYAARLYSALRDADAGKPSLIAIEMPDARKQAQDSRWIAVLDRLTRASKPLV